MSKLEDQEFDSDSSDDEDFVPDYADMDSDGGSDDDDGDIEGDEGEVGGQDESKPGKRRKQPNKAKGGRASSKSKKRKAAQSLSSQQELSSTTTADQIAAEQQARKRRIDALWEDLKNTRPASQPSPASAAAKTAGLQAAISAYSSGSGSTTSTAPGSANGGSKPGTAKMVTITMTYDFAGEKVTVSKEVPEDSKDAKEAAAKGLIKGLPGATTTTTAGGSSSSTASSQKKTAAVTASTSPSSITDKNGSTTGDMNVDHAPKEGESERKDGPDVAAAPKRIRIQYVRAKSRLDDLAALYGVKKPAKLTTLEKSKLDWNSFVGKEGIEDELKHHNKDGYMEKAAFLERTYAHKEQEIKALRRKR